MDATTAAIRYKGWMQVFEDCSNSGLTKHVYCQQNGINEKQFYYYQRRIRAMLSMQAEHPALQEGGSGVVEFSTEQQTNQPQIVKLQLSGAPRTSSATINFSVNGMNLSVSEEIPTPFLAKLLEAASHGSR